MVTYARRVIDFRLQKEELNRVCITAGGNLIKTPRDLTIRTADLPTSNILWNSILGIERAKFVGFDISNCYLGTYTERYEYLHAGASLSLSISLFLWQTNHQYKLDKRKKNGHIYLEISKTVYGLPVVGALANT